MNIFSHLVDKDLFLEVTRHLLAKRLLNSRSASIEAEKSVISKIKNSFGTQATGKLEGMLTDLEMAEQTDRSFQEFLEKTEKKP